MRSWQWWFAAYAALLAIVCWAMVSARERALSRWAMPESIAHWQVWRDDVQRQQAAPAPVERRVPESAEPPTLVLMRDHFVVMLAAALLFSTALYWVIAWFVSGIFMMKAGAARGGKENAS